MQECAFDHIHPIYHLTYFFCRASEIIGKFVYRCLSHNIFWYFLAWIKFYWNQGFKKMTKTDKFQKNLNQVIYQTFLLVLNYSTNPWTMQLRYLLLSSKVSFLQKYRSDTFIVICSAFEGIWLSTHQKSAKLNPSKNLIKNILISFHIILGVSQTLPTLIISKMARPKSSHLIPQA